MVRFAEEGDIMEIQRRTTSFKSASTYEKLSGRSVLNRKSTILKKINVLFIIHFCIGKYSINIDTSWTYVIYSMQF